ncbi:phenylalanine--tRNA ligase subunit alpha [Halarsenatibacter silvermanii]|uniref:Phenylalanine--tRNA ligase alpha subunit n=1 Tax=Halarsenatibacter silvermanii TaxID=321763 RepID=A0A1G9K392_9FIRM|nr:phenylalanine--tRNA ligase subunit alpha [Halarsenatibacter silvermanii]SDL43956.1 phenylalanyl-tRNA synthetase, alpha subunit [Halarsenatibacter silvermanii]
MDVDETIAEIEENFENDYRSVDTLDELEDVKVKYLGKEGEVEKLFGMMGSIPDEKRPILGKAANELKEDISSRLKEKRSDLEKKLKEQKLKEERLDVTLPGAEVEKGSRHPIEIVKEELEDIFIGMGFKIAEGPEAEDEYHNFKALNIPEDHPARDLQDTLYIDDDLLLRTHTSPVQIRTMEDTEPPIRIIAPGRVYRADELDASHSPVFHQLEGLVVNENITFGDLKGTIRIMVEEIYGQKRDVRFRPSYFPFTEPSAEVDVSCGVCEGAGCKLCSRTGWLEIMGSGMVHPKVLEISGIDPHHFSGFAFGMGIDRIAMLKYGIEDIRLLFENDRRFLQQFK